MDLNPTRNGKAMVVHPQGRIDHGSAPEFQTALLDAVQQCGGDPDTLVIDMAGVEYISSVGLRALMIASKQAKAQGARIAAAALTPVVREIFEISRFQHVVTSYETVDAAIAGG